MKWLALYLIYFFALSVASPFDLQIEMGDHETFILSITAPVYHLCRLELSSNGISWAHGLNIWTGRTLGQGKPGGGGQSNGRVWRYPPTDASGSDSFNVLVDHHESTDEQTNVVVIAAFSEIPSQWFWRARIQDPPNDE